MQLQYYLIIITTTTTTTTVIIIIVIIIIHSVTRLYLETSTTLIFRCNIAGVVFETVFYTYF
jgi:hypothetical protein